MGVEMIRKMEDILLVNVPPNLIDSEVVELRKETLKGIRRFASRWVLLDFSMVEVCDSFFGRFIHGMAEMARLMGVEVVVCGLRAPVVITLVEMGFDLPGIHAVLDLDEALALSREARQEQLSEADIAEELFSDGDEEEEGSQDEPESSPTAKSAAEDREGAET